MNLLERWQHAPALFKNLTVVFGSIAAVTGAITGVNAAWPVTEPLLVAHRGYVREVSDETVKPLRLAMDKQAVATDRQSVIILKGQLDSAQRDPAAATSPIVKERIDDLRREITETIIRIEKAVTTDRR